MRKLIIVTLLFACSCGGAGAPRPESPGGDAEVPEKAAVPAKAPVAARYQIVTEHRVSGACTDEVGADGTRKVECAWVDNGRGPVVHGQVRLAEDGTIASLAVTGTDTFGIALDETLAIAGGRATWKSQADKGDRALDKPAFYVPVAPLPPALGWIAKAALAAGGSLALLPIGEVRAEKEADTTIRGRHLTCYALVGIDFAPMRVWLDDDQGFFGAVNPWWSLVPDGWSDAIDPLVEIEKGLQAKRDAADAKRLAHLPPEAGLAIVHARVFDAVKKRWLDDQAVVVVGGRIAAVGPAARVKLPAGAEVIDANGKALLPGLWDMHVHLGTVDGPLNIAAGVTTVRDMDNDPDLLADFAARYDAGTAIGPHVMKTGLVEGRGEKALASKFYADTEAEGRAAIDYYASHGYAQFKFYNSVKPELVAPLAKAAHDRGLRVSGHVPFGMIAEDAVRAGYDEIQHINQVMLEFFADRTTDTRTLVRFTLPGEKAASLDLASKPVRDFIALLKEKKTVIDPTAVTFEQLYLARPGEIDPSIRAVADRLPPMVARMFLAGGLEAGGDKDALYRASYKKMLDFVAALHTAGIRIVPGTDGVSGFWLDRELELYAEAGIPKGDVLYLATLGAARVMGRDKATGSIEKGKDADLILVDGDPLARMSDVRKVVTTVRGGIVYDAAAVYAAVGVRP
jgi:hypothetical protein